MFAWMHFSFEILETMKREALATAKLVIIVSAVKAAGASRR